MLDLQKKRKIKIESKPKCDILKKSIHSLNYTVNAEYEEMLAKKAEMNKKRAVSAF